MHPAQFTYRLSGTLHWIGRMLSTTGWVIKRTFELLEALGEFALGAFLAVCSVALLRETDQALMKFVSEDLQPTGHYSVTDERDFFLALLAIGIGIAVWGCKELRDWFRPATV